MELIEKLQEYYTNNKQKVVFFLGVIGVMIVIIIGIVIAIKIITSKMSYEKLEEKLENATYKYLTEYPVNSPNANNPKVVISAETLIEQGYIKELKKYVKDASCTGNVEVIFENNDNKYQAYLTCNNFRTEKFLDKLESNNETSSFGDGLYQMNGEFIFRGENPKNYLKLNDELWRIIKIDKNNNIQIAIEETEDDDDMYATWDDRYNAEPDALRGINNFALSRALSTLKDIYSKKYKQYQNLLTPYNLCIGKRAEENYTKDGSTECSQLITNQYIGLIPAYDYINASLDNACIKITSRECQNYNYLVNEDLRWWTMTADPKDTFHAYKANYHGEMESTYTSDKGDLRYVLTLHKDVLYKSGEGTKENPYIVR